MTQQLDPQAQALLDGGATARAIPMSSLPVKRARANIRKAFLSHGSGPDLNAVEDLHIPGPNGGTPARLFRFSERPAPLVMFIHGGGWVVNDVDTHDRLCRLGAVASQCHILSIEHHPAPESKYPDPLNEALRCWIWATNNSEALGADTPQLGIAGDSSGGTLALGVSGLCVDLGLPVPSMQCLFYPVTDHYSAPSPTYDTHGTGYSLDAATMRWFWENYLSDEWDPTDPYLFPARRVNFDGYPPTLLALAEFDPLNFEGHYLADRLTESEIPVRVEFGRAQMHGWAMQTKNIEAAASMVDQVFKQAGDIMRGQPLNDAGAS
jgi:acetyl esterase